MGPVTTLARTFQFAWAVHRLTWIRKMVARMVWPKLQIEVREQGALVLSAPVASGAFRAPLQRHTVQRSVWHTRSGRAASPREVGDVK